MGRVVDKQQLNDAQDLYRLIVYTDEGNLDAISINTALAMELIKLKPSRRTMQLSSCLHRVISSIPENSIIKDIDVMFNPNYKIDVMRILIEENKRTRFSVIWPGKLENEKLCYSEEGFPDYRTFDISDYDILCVR